MDYANPHKAGREKTRACSGQAAIESIIVIGLILLIFVGIFEIARLFAAEEILNYAAARGARAATVGFNDFMIEKTIRVAAIPNAGAMTVPDDTAGLARYWAVEQERIPAFLGSRTWAEADYILNYERWPIAGFSFGNADFFRVHVANWNRDSSPLSVRVTQNIPVNAVLFRAFYPTNYVPLRGECRIENHCMLYLTDLPESTNAPTP